MIRALVTLSVFAATLFGQRSVPAEYMYHRVWAVVPLIGSGATGDPIRPMFVPSPSAPSPLAASLQTSTDPPAPPDLLGYQMQISDDGKFALVEFVFHSPLAFHNFLAKAATAPNAGVAAPLLQAVSADGSNLSALTANVAALKTTFESSFPGLKLFERGKATPAEILTEFRKRKADYSFASGSVVSQ